MLRLQLSTLLQQSQSTGCRDNVQPQRETNREAPFKAHIPEKAQRRPRLQGQMPDLLSQGDLQDSAQGEEGDRHGEESSRRKREASR